MRHAARLVAGVAFLMLLAGMGAAQRRALSPYDKPSDVHNGFITGAIFRGMSAADQKAYAGGVIDGMLLAPVFGAPKENLSRFEACLTGGMTDSQVAAILNLYLNQHPEVWHQPIHLGMYQALGERCP